MTQTSFHYYFPVFDYLIQVIVFYNDAWADFTLTFEKPWQTLASLMAYWVSFNIAWPKHDPTNGVRSWRGKHETLDFKALVNVFRLDPSSLT